MIKLNAFFKSFGPKKVLRGLNLETESGEIVTLVGNNGSGKTTLLRILTTLDAPDSYNVAEIDGFDLSSNKEEVRSRVGYLSHNPPYYPELTGVENLKFWLDLNSVDNSEEKARNLLAQVGFHWGLDTNERLGEQKNTLEWCLNRITLGFIYDKEWC